MKSQSNSNCDACMSLLRRHELYFRTESSFRLINEWINLTGTISPRIPLPVDRMREFAEGNFENFSRFDGYLFAVHIKRNTIGIRYCFGENGNLIALEFSGVSFAFNMNSSQKYIRVHFECWYFLNWEF